MVHQCVQFDKTVNGNLLITLLPKGRDELQEMIDDKGETYLETDDCLYELIEQQLCNGWERVLPEEVGALTDGLLITDDYERNDDGVLTVCGRIYWDEAYQVRSAAKELWENGKVTFVGQE